MCDKVTNRALQKVIFLYARKITEVVLTIVLNVTRGYLLSTCILITGDPHSQPHTTKPEMVFVQILEETSTLH